MRHDGYNRASAEQMMVSRNNPPKSPPLPSAFDERQGGGPDKGFDRWLVGQLHQVYDPVLEEPLPDDLARLVDAFDTKPVAAPNGDGSSVAEAAQDDVAAKS